jgi:hypothetical protein
MAGATATEIIGLPAEQAWAQANAKWSWPEEARSIAQKAYIYAFPIVQNYLSIYQVALDPNGSHYKGPSNDVHNVARVFTPAATAHHYC